MEIYITEIRLQFKSPVLGQPTYSSEAHYYGRRVFAVVDGVDRIFRFKKDVIPFYTTEDDIIEAIKVVLLNE